MESSIAEFLTRQSACELLPTGQVHTRCHHRAAAAYQIGAIGNGGLIEGGGGQRYFFFARQTKSM